MALVLVMALLHGPPFSEPQQPAVAALPHRLGVAAEERKAMPRLLSAHDAATYARIFALQQAEEWDAAAAETAKLRNPILLGHVRYQHLMHPHSGRASYGDLRGWLLSYRDHPGAAKVHALALSRQPKGAAPPPQLEPVPRGPGFHPAHSRAQAPIRPYQPDSAIARRILREVESLCFAGRPAQALRYLERERRRTALADADLALGQQAIGRAFFHAGSDAQALALLDRAARIGAGKAPMADWWAGLAAWRLENYARAARHFTALAASDRVAPPTRSAGAFWAARSHLKLRQAQEAEAMLERAAEDPNGFYGLLARHRLGRDADLPRPVRAFTAADWALLRTLPGARRTIALVEAGQRHLAEQEMKRLRAGADRRRATALLALASALGLPESAMRLAHDLATEDGSWEAALHPIPPWVPEGGFAVDPAFVFALMRQESRFDAFARSHAGARGLLQLMPRTASAIAEDDSLMAQNRHRLYDPVLNLTLGELYLRHLVERLGPDAILVAIAYNAGPSRLRQWLAEIDHRNDPLLFMESLPARETRRHVENVLANYWIYRMRLGRDLPLSETVTAATWPAPPAEAGPIRLSALPPP